MNTKTIIGFAILALAYVLYLFGALSFEQFVVPGIVINACLTISKESKKGE